MYRSAPRAHMKLRDLLYTAMHELRHRHQDNIPLVTPKLRVFGALAHLGRIKYQLLKS